MRRITSRIGRDKATVSCELKRVLWFASNENDSYRPYRLKRLKTGAWTGWPFYSAMTAQRKAETRARRLRKPMRMAYDPLLAWVTDVLRRGWTLMDAQTDRGQAQGRVPGRSAHEVSHECLYQWIYAKPQRALDLRQYLPRGKRHRTRAKGCRSKGPRIPMRVPIAERPRRIMSRREFGHFESDTVVGAAPSRWCIDTQVERRSRRLFARFVPDKGPLATARVEYDIYKDIPTSARIRRYLPKRTGFDDLTDADLQAIV